MELEPNVLGVLSHFLNQTLSNHFMTLFFRGIILLQAWVTVVFLLL